MIGDVLYAVVGIVVLYLVVRWLWWLWRTVARGFANLGRAIAGRDEHKGREVLSATRL